MLSQCNRRACNWFHSDDPKSSSPISTYQFVCKDNHSWLCAQDEWIFRSPESCTQISHNHAMTKVFMKLNNCCIISMETQLIVRLCGSNLPLQIMLCDQFVKAHLDNDRRWNLWSALMKSVSSHSVFSVSYWIESRIRATTDCINNGRSCCDATHWFVDCRSEVSRLHVGRRHLGFWSQKWPYSII